MRWTPASVRRLAGEVVAAAQARRFLVPSCVASEESVARYHHEDLRDLDDVELDHELLEASTAVRTLPKAERIRREWWIGRYRAVVTEIRSRRRRVA